MRIKPAILWAATALGLVTAEACGPDFQVALTACGTVCLKEIRTSGLFDSLVPIAATAVAPLSEAETGAITTAELEKQDLSPEQQAELSSMRAAAGGDEAYNVGADLPPAIRLYTAGAVDFLRARDLMRQSHPAEPGSTEDSPSSAIDSALTAAIGRFAAASIQPENQGLGRVLWAEYMLGRAYRLRAHPDDLDTAEMHFHRVISMVQKGSSDPMTLGNAALGELARIALDRKETGAALTLYAEQAHSPGAEHSVDSLIRVLRRMPNVDGAQLATEVRDPLLQRLIVAYAVSRVAATCDFESCRDDSPDGFAQQLLTTLKGLPPSMIVAGDQIAALAYAVGDYDFAERTVVLTQSALAEWIRGKLALHRGALQEADSAFAKAALHFQTETADPGVSQRFYAEWGAVKLARSDYLEAMNQLLTRAPQFDQDIAYIAERVLTVSELKQYVDAHPDSGALLHSILATRLARADRVKDAIEYYPTDKAIPEVYAREWDLANKSADRTERARAWYSLARMDIANGMELRGAQLGPDGAIWRGGSDVDEKPSDLATIDEKKRFAASEINPNRRFHYRALGVRHLLLAVDELPKRSGVASAVLCQGAKLLRHHGEEPDGDLVKQLYRKYQNVGKPADWDRNFGAACPVPRFDSVP